MPRRQPATCVRCFGLPSTTTVPGIWTRSSMWTSSRMAPCICWWELPMWTPSVPKGSATDQHAAAESTSVYIGVATFPMLPAELSTDLTSLLDAQDRISIIIELHILDSGDVKAHDVYPAWLRNRAKLAYSSTGAWLEGRAPIPPAVANVPGMEVQLRLQRRHRKSCAASASYTERSHSSRSKPRRCCKMAK